MQYGVGTTAHALAYMKVVIFANNMFALHRKIPTDICEIHHHSLDGNQR